MSVNERGCLFDKCLTFLDPPFKRDPPLTWSWDRMGESALSCFVSDIDQIDAHSVGRLKILDINLSVTMLLKICSTFKNLKVLITNNIPFIEVKNFDFSFSKIDCLIVLKTCILSEGLTKLFPNIEELFTSTLKNEFKFSNLNNSSKLTFSKLKLFSCLHASIEAVNRLSENKLETIDIYLSALDNEKLNTVSNSMRLKTSIFLDIPNEFLPTSFKLLQLFGNDFGKNLNNTKIILNSKTEDLILPKNFLKTPDQVLTLNKKAIIGIDVDDFLLDVYLRLFPSISLYNGDNFQKMCYLNCASLNCNFNLFDNKKFDIWKNIIENRVLKISSEVITNNINVISLKRNIFILHKNFLNVGITFKNFDEIASMIKPFFSNFLIIKLNISVFESTIENLEIKLKSCEWLNNVEINIFSNVKLEHLVE